MGLTPMLSVRVWTTFENTCAFDVWYSRKGVLMGFPFW